jgi:hypothetical protein
MTNGNGLWARRFISEVDRAVAELQDDRTTELRAGGLQSDLRQFEALLQVLGRAAEGMAKERGLDPLVARQAISPGKAGSQRADLILEEFEDRIESIKGAPETPTSFLGISYEALYGQAAPVNDRRPGRSSLHRRDHGVFFTPMPLADSLTASALSGESVARRQLDVSILDPACGPATFLVSALRDLAKQHLSAGAPPSQARQVRRAIAERCLFGVDRDAAAISIARTIIWLEVGDESLDIGTLDDRIVCGDSLTCRPESWKSLLPASGGLISGQGLPRFDVVLANPPWGSIKPLRREFITHAERLRLHGSAPWAPTGAPVRLWTEDLDDLWDDYSKWTRKYAASLLADKEYAGLRGKDSGDPDLYQFFLVRLFELLGDEGRAGLVIPAGFQRTAGAADLRRLYLGRGHFESITEVINRGRIFPIHGMFRFLIATYQRGAATGIARLRLGLSSLDEASKPMPRSEKNAGKLSLAFIRRVGGQALMIPDVGTTAEARLLRKLYSQHPTLGETAAGDWSVRFRRELDMTNDAEHFVPIGEARRLGWAERSDATWVCEGETLLPLYEGRMIHQFDAAAKGYRYGSRREAVWEPLNGGPKRIEPQFLVPESLARRRGVSLVRRAGFCDVSGHANERTVLASLIPARAVCGNKVPVCIFDNDDPRLPLIWIAIANSFVIDWIIRRWVSTTINYFYWWNTPFPRVAPESVIGRSLAEMAAQLITPSAAVYGLDWAITTPLGQSMREDLRAEIDAVVADLFDISSDEFDLILRDFPLIDRHQARVDSLKSATRAVAELALMRRRGGSRRDLAILQHEVDTVRGLGAVAYLPSEGAGSTSRLAGTAIPLPITIPDAEVIPILDRAGREGREALDSR